MGAAQFRKSFSQAVEVTLSPCCIYSRFCHIQFANSSFQFLLCIFVLLSVISPVSLFSFFQLELSNHDSTFIASSNLQKKEQESF